VAIAGGDDHIERSFDAAEIAEPRRRGASRGGHAAEGAAESPPPREPRELVEIVADYAIFYEYLK